ncbi:MAG TPA: hypothetical protein VLF69_06530, partial [Candidatus Saccharimonadales bacterium]|nr:hypothetical protein [Candidatus Saccharimonadales bacterium]
MGAMYRYSDRDAYRRHHRLAVHSGVLALQSQQRRGRLRQRLTVAGLSTIGALLVLTLLSVVPSRFQPLRAWYSTEPRPTITLPHVIDTDLPQSATLIPVAKPPKPQQPKTAFTTPIVIKGDASCQSDTLAALELLADKAPKHYQTVTTYMAIIECVTQGSGMAAYENPPRYLVGDLTRRGGTIWYAGTIVHDAGHSKLY